MRHFLPLAALWLLSGAAVAGPLPAAGLMLNKDWRYHPGDDPARARPGSEFLIT